MDRNSQVQEAVHQLPKMPRAQLTELWEQTFGHRPAKRLRPEMMRPVLACRLQELSGDTPRGRLNQAARAHHPKGSNTTQIRYKPGTRIIREWKGKTYEVLISAEGYFYNGKTYRSLSPIATEITGTKWSGPAFFGTKRKEVAR